MTGDQLRNASKSWTWSTFLSEELPKYRDIPEVMSAAAHAWDALFYSGYLDTWDNMRSTERIFGYAAEECFSRPNELLKRSDEKALAAMKALLDSMNTNAHLAVPLPTGTRGLGAVFTAIRAAAEKEGIFLQAF